MSSPDGVSLRKVEGRAGGSNGETKDCKAAGQLTQDFSDVFTNKLGGQRNAEEIFVIEGG